ncbi:MAG: hypothetical protein WCI74_21285, partial [Actinomycetes bacterium]
MSVLFALQFVYPETREMIRELTDDPHRYRLLIDSVHDHITDDHARAKFVAAVNTCRFPVRSTVERYWKAHVDADLMNAAIVESGIALALSRGHFDPATMRNTAEPDVRNSVYSDGTVTKPPSDETFDTAIDPKTGEIWHPKVDVGSRSHKQNSHSEPIIHGTKITALLTRGPDYLAEIFLGMCVTDAADPASEANDAVDLIAKVRDHLHQIDPGRGIQVAIHDGAATTEHHRRLIAEGTLLMNLPPAKKVADDPHTGAKIREEEFIGNLGTWHHRDSDCPGHRLVGIAGDYHLQELVEGGFVYTKLAHRPHSTTTKGKIYYYEHV